MRTDDTLEAVTLRRQLVEDDPLIQASDMRAADERARFELAHLSCTAPQPGRDRRGRCSSKDPFQSGTTRNGENHHIMLVGQGALEFALMHGFKRWTSAPKLPKEMGRVEGGIVRQRRLSLTAGKE